MNNITKRDILRFLNSYGPLYLLNDSPLKNALIHIEEQCNTYVLFAKSKDYILQYWEYEHVLYDDILSNLYNKLDLKPIFENYHKWYLREQAINKILDEI